MEKDNHCIPIAYHYVYIKRVKRVCMDLLFISLLHYDRLGMRQINGCPFLLLA